MSRKAEPDLYDAAITQHGLRFTDQRRQVYDTLLGRRDHPTAVEVFLRVKEKMPSISLATVYNCLETLTECGLVKHVTCERGPSRFCPNLEEHGHFFCEQCGAVLDVPLRSADHLDATWEFPGDIVITHHEATFHGLCPNCTKSNSSTTKRKAKKPTSAI